MHIKKLLLISSLLPILASAQTSADFIGAQSDENLFDARWGDLGDGTYANPVLNADYSDPDVIRVGDKYYLTCSEFHFMGMPILESADMVNWKVIARVHDTIDLPGFDSMGKYGGGTWAPALRYHDGRFWIYVCTPNEGLFMTSADRPEGPWSPLYCVESVGGWEDPCPLWEDDGQTAYLGRSQLGGGPIYIHKMSYDGKRLLDDGVKVYEGPTAEGTKLFKKDGYYYLSIPEGGVGTGWQTVLRSKSIYGPYEGKRVLETGSTRVNGPHQGALVDTPDGEWWFYHFQSTGVLGRVTHLQPVKWVDGFPIIGIDYDGNGVGEPVKIHAKPNTGVCSTPSVPQTSDTFDDGVLGVQWQFNHNPDFTRLSVSENPGLLTLTLSKAAKLREARNTLTQKLMGNTGRAVVAVNVSRMKPGDRAGLGMIGGRHYGCGIMMEGSTPKLYIEADGAMDAKGVLNVPYSKTVYIALTYDTENRKNQFSYSTNGTRFVKFGKEFDNNEGDWKGCRIALFGYATKEDGGKALFDDFSYTCDGPMAQPAAVAGVSDDSEARIFVSGKTVRVSSSQAGSVSIYSLDGRKVGAGLVGSSIDLPSQGVYAVVSGNRVWKVAVEAPIQTYR